MWAYILTEKLNISELFFSKVLFPNVFFHWALFIVLILVVGMEHFSV